MKRRLWLLRGSEGAFCVDTPTSVGGSGRAVMGEVVKAGQESVVAC